MKNLADTGVKYDNGKLRMDLIPVSLEKAVASVLGFGAGKYGDRNWEGGIQYSRVYAALRRHLADFWAGIKYDYESDLPTIWHVACCVAFLVHFEEHRDLYAEFDDRPVTLGTALRQVVENGDEELDRLRYGTSYNDTWGEELRDFVAGGFELDEPKTKKPKKKKGKKRGK